MKTVFLHTDCILCEYIMVREGRVRSERERKKKHIDRQTDRQLDKGKNQSTGEQREGSEERENRRERERERDGKRKKEIEVEREGKVCIKVRHHATLKFYVNYLI